METWILFLLKSIVISGLLTAWYILALRGRRLHQYNRMFLLTALFASLAIPFLHFRLFTIPAAVTGKLAPAASFVNFAGDTASNSFAVQHGQIQFSWQAIAGIIAAAISLVLLIVLLVRILKVRMMYRQNTITRLHGVNLVLTDSPKAPFTFLKYIFWNRSIPLQDEIGQLIFKHELTHIKQGHTYDKLACQVVTCIFWFNPFYWIIQKELNLVHEFVADEQAVGNYNTEAFALMLLRSHNNGSYLAPQHHFFSSSTKRRLAMLQNAAAPSYTLLRRFMALPLIAGTVLLFSFNSGSPAAGNVAPAKKKIAVLLDAGHGGKDAGEQYGSYTEKDICLKYAKRIQELSPAYNVDVRLSRDNDIDVPLADRVVNPGKPGPDVFISLHVGDEPGKDKAKGDFDIYVSPENTHAAQSVNYSSAILQAMADNGIIPGIAEVQDHVCSSICGCNSATPQAIIPHTANENLYVLKHAPVPAMVMVLGNIKNQEGMQQLTDAAQLDNVCNAVLKGIVDGSAIKKEETINTTELWAGKQPQRCGTVSSNR